MRQKISPHARFQLYAKPDELTGCVNWQGHRDRWGYGWFYWNGRDVAAHRAAWMLATGQELSSKVCVLHRCDNPSCVNVDHLFLGTHRDNAHDKIRKGRMGLVGAGKLPYGVERSGNRYRARLRSRVGKGPQKHLGTFATIEEAAEVASKARDRWLRDEVGKS